MNASKISKPPRPPLLVPKAWLAALAALFVAPWVIAAAIYARHDGPESLPATPATAVDPGTVAAGPWGQLTVSPIIVSPPLEYIPADTPAGAVVWHLPATTPQVAATFLQWTGMPAADASRLLNSARPDTATNGLILLPDAGLVRGLAPDVRGRLYTQLAKSRLNRAQAESYRFHGTSAEEWFTGSSVSAATRRIVEPLIYRDGPFLHFADLETVRGDMKDPAEWRLLRKALMRSSTLLVRLTLANPADVSGLVQYWGARGRRLDIRPLLESVAGGAPDQSIDLIHLLPALARNNLYRYPKLTAEDLDKPLLANCLWSALNFFEAEPNDRFLDVGTALNTLKTDYYVVEDRFELGDVVAFLDANGVVFHTAVHLAGGLAFTKNGTSPMAPWTIMPIENIRAFYKTRSEHTQLIYHRRKDL